MLDRNFFSFLTISWISPLIRKGSRTPLQYEDLDDLPKNLHASSLAHVLDPTMEKFRKLRIETAATESQQGSRPTPTKNIKISFLGPIIYSQMSLMIIAIVFDAINLICSLITPIIIGHLILYITPGTNKSRLIIPSGYGLAAALLAAQILITCSAFSQAQVIAIMQQNSQTIVSGAVYRKCLRLSHSAQKEFSQGRIITLVNIDSGYIGMAVPAVLGILFAPLQIIVSFYLLYNLIGIASLSGIGVLLFVLGLEVFVTGFYMGNLKAYLHIGDQRLKLMREMMYGMKFIKFRSLEKYFKTRIDTIRTHQFTHLKTVNILRLLLLSLYQLAVIAMPIVAIAASVLGSRDVKPHTIFPALTLLMQLMRPFIRVSDAFPALAIATSAWVRINEFLRASEMDESTHTAAKSTEKGVDAGAVVVKTASFMWPSAIEPGSTTTTQRIQPKTKSGNHGDDSESIEFINPSSDSRDDKDMDKSSVVSTPVIVPSTVTDNVNKKEFMLTNIDLDIHRGQLVAIVGSVGSGKSSLLSALCGEMVRVGGTVEVTGSIAYCAQEPWIMTDTIRGNITFGRTRDDKRVDDVVRAVCLDQDMKTLSMGVDTGIGERGINLSGGQRARVALARALYMDTDIVMMDDPLASLDAHVSHNVFHTAIKQHMCGKTVLMVTNQLQVLQHVDHVIVMRNGRVVEQGTFMQLTSTQTSVLTKLLRNHAIQDTTKTDSLDTDTTPKPKPGQPRVKDTVTITSTINIQDEEERVIGMVTLSTYMRYINASGGILFIGLFIVIACLTTVAMASTNISLALWTGNKTSMSVETNMVLYGSLGSLQVLFLVLLNALIVYFGQVASRYFHDEAMGSLMRAPMRFFESQPVGRILNRMSRDIETFDNNFSGTLFLFAVGVCLLNAYLLVLVYSSTFTIGFFVTVLCIDLLLFGRYQSTNRELRRLVSIERSPLLSHISETLSGLSTIRAYGDSDRFVSIQHGLMDRANKPVYYSIKAALWIRIRIILSTSGLVFMIAVLGVWGKIDAATTGLALTYAATIASATSLAMLGAGNLEAEFSTVERLDYYVQMLPREKEAVLVTDPGEGKWPTRGEIAIRGLEVRYASRPEHPAVTGVTVDIHAGEKIAVVGRTGSGKSTLMSSLFRIVEPSSGSIVIDGVDVSTLGLATLRSRLQIIPQEPVLFSGTVRSNLCFDPTDDDSALWDVLDRVGMRDHVSSMPGKLDAVIEEGGENLSVGQRQLLCLARAILTHPKILVIDEATDAIDTTTDQLIHTYIKTQFGDTTVITIAHRLNSVVAFDRVMVMENGHVVEFDTPRVLLSVRGSKFSQLVDATGDANARHLRDVVGAGQSNDMRDESQDSATSEFMSAREASV